MSDDELVGLILDYAGEHNSFDTDFIDSISDALSEYGELTCRQSEACENIIRRYRMVKWKEEQFCASSLNEFPWD